MIAKLFLAAVTCAGVLAGPPRLVASEPGVDVGALRAFLQQALDLGEDEPDELTVRFVAVAADLNGDGLPEYVVYLIGNPWCGTGGCTVWILAKQGESFSVIAHTAAVRLPIRMLDQRDNSWRSLVATGRGHVEMIFDGSRYPEFAVLPPRPRVKGNRGLVLIEPKSAQYALYP